ncbi:MAG: hypothetical protein AB8B91_03995 [Rubripirellula sp.]
MSISLCMLLTSIQSQFARYKMYEFDDDGWFDEDWDQLYADAGEADSIVAGWLIQRTTKAVSDVRGPVGKRPEAVITDEPQFLQIGTGQWCSAKYATLFPLASAAEVYAEEFGYVLGYHVKLVKHRF